MTERFESFYDEVEGVKTFARGEVREIGKGRDYTGLCRDFPEDSGLALAHGGIVGIGRDLLRHGRGRSENSLADNRTR